MSKRPRVAIVATGFKPEMGGGPEYAYQIARAFNARDLDLRIYTPHIAGSDEFDRNCDLPIQRLRPKLKTRPGVTHAARGFPWHKITKIASVARLALKERLLCASRSAPDLIYIPNMCPLALMAPKGGPKVVTTFHGGDVYSHVRSSESTSFKRNIFQKATRRSDLMLANSSYTKQSLVEVGADADKIMVTGCGADWSRFKEIRDADAAKQRLELTGRKVILTLGRLVDRKGFDTVVKCMPRLRERFPNVLYVIAGAGPQREELERMVAELKVGDCVRMAGRVPDEHVLDYMAACDVYAMPNRETEANGVEGFGIVYIEANSACKPVIGGRNGGVVDAVEHEKTGLLVDPYDVDDCAAALERLLGDDELSARLGKQGRERFERAYTWESVAARAVDRMLALLD